MVELVWLIPTLPLVGFLFLLLAGNRLGEPKAGWLATAASACSFVVAFVVFLGLLTRTGDNRSFEQVLFDWLPVGSLNVEAGFLVDPLSMTMALFVTGVGTLIHLYSVGYMHGDPKFSKFFLYLNLFLFSMLMLVLGNNLVITFLGWEGVGTCSYLLISFWHKKDSAATAGKKAFVTNRVGDWGFMIAMFLLWSSIGTLTYTEIAQSSPMATVTGTAVSLLLFVAAAGKSAQLPLYVWLPDAMEGPTPVSAMVHAATMVTSGVYLLVRMNHVLTNDALIVIAVVGAATALFAALAAVAQQDIKKVLAYSTVSQLGYMFLAIGSGAYVAAIFHVITHAFFKALLFLGSGSVIHGMHDEQDMKKMGALRSLMPITAGTFIIGWLAIAGVPPFSGFWSKDEILLAAWEQPNIGPILWVVGLVTALLTAYYMSRQVFLVFFGDKRWDDGVQPHESPWTMTLPLCVLAVAAAMGGLINLPVVADWLYLEHFLEPIFSHPHHFVSSSTTKIILATIAVLAGLVGIGVAAAVWLLNRVKADRLEPKVFENAMYIDATYSKVVGGVGQKAFEMISNADKKYVDGAINQIGKSTIRLGVMMRPLQSGYMRNYAIGITIGGLALLIWIIAGAS
ncbi:MAG: NADH-quinone oxidoreductase subunit L [Actinomycetota bacterium]|nr:NADH-quinone oxidoreductase subunit L [Actinomycetota bacterium]MDG2119590.1 NADH-quinone oxidoreductase subunit L [Actinomycetota bacterium]